MRITLVDENGDLHTGTTVEAIARRLYGRKVEVAEIADGEYEFITRHPSGRAASCDYFAVAE